ncbi:amylo-alpha-1,6-glucosidase [Thermoproteota archaeon]
MNKLTLILTTISKIFKKQPLQQDEIQSGFDIALQTLRSRYTDHGILAGRTHFSDIWLRDSCFASFGSLSAGDFDIVKQNLITMINNMGERGQIPLRIGQKYFYLNYFGIKGRPKPRYVEDKGVSIPADSNTLFTITAEAYISKSKDLDFARDYFPLLKQAVDWTFNLDEDHDLLIEEGPYAGWADSVRKRGKVLYSNVLHYKALDSFGRICRMINKNTEASHYENLTKKIKEKMDDLFWNGQYYIDWIHRHRHTYFSADGNLLAIIFGLADRAKASKILRCIHELDLDHGFSSQTSYPKYRYRHIFPLFFPFQIQDYHNGLHWLWINCVYAVARHRLGYKDDAVKIIEATAHQIVKYKGVYEVYFKGKPVKRFFYKSEKGFAWSAGLFVWACKETGVI